MGQLAIRKPLSALRLLNEMLLPGACEGDAFELEIHASSRDVAMRDMAAFLELADHIYGRMHPDGYRSYVMRPQEYMRIEEIRAGSALLTISGLLQNPSTWMIVWLCLKYVPFVLEKTANAYNSYEQGALARENRKHIRHQMEQDPARENRKQIRHQMEQDPVFTELPRERRNELAVLIESLLQLDGSLLVRAGRYAEEHVIDIQLRVKK